jgi:hypothetical protein
MAGSDWVLWLAVGVLALSCPVSAVPSPAYSRT